MRPTRLPASGAKPSAAKTSTPARTAPLPPRPPAPGRGHGLLGGVPVRLAPPASPPRSPTRRFFASLLLLSWLLLPAALAEAPEQKLARSDDRWVRRTLERMSLDEKIGQLLMVPYYGGFARTDSEEFPRLGGEARELHGGGPHR